MTLRYTVDPANRIVAIDGPWDEFAEAGGAPDLTRRSVLGRPLFDYLSGPEAEELVGLLLERVRLGAQVRMSFRCDSPSLRRFMRLEMRGMADGNVACESTVEREQARPPQPLLDPTMARSDDLLIVCGWCKKVKLAEDRWVEVEEAVGVLAFSEMEALPRLSHGICDPCAEAIRQSVQSRPPGARPSDQGGSAEAAGPTVGSGVTTKKS